MRQVWQCPVFSGTRPEMARAVALEEDLHRSHEGRFRGLRHVRGAAVPGNTLGAPRL